MGRKRLSTETTIASGSKQIWMVDRIHGNVDMIIYLTSTYMAQTEFVCGRGGCFKLVLFCSPNQNFQNVLDFISFFPWAKSDMVAMWGNVGMTWIWSRINIFCPPCLPWAFNTFLDPSKHFWKWNSTNIIVEYQFIKCIAYTHDKESFHLWIKNH
jgi:hypothetical protein